MKVFTRTTSVLLAMVIMLAAMSGCTGKPDQPADGVVRLTIWVHETDSPEGLLYKRLVEEFNTANQGKIRVELTAIPRTGDASGYEDKVNAAITTQSLPDVLTCDGPNVAAYAENGLIAPITQYVRDMDLSDFNPAIRKQGTYKGETYGLGANDSSVAIYYNKDMLDRAGVTAPQSLTDAWTWNELYQNALKLSGNGVFGLDLNLAYKGEWNTFQFLPMVQSNGGEIVAEDGKTAEGIINSPQNIETLSFIKKLVDDKVVSNAPEEKGFELGKVALLMTGSWQTASMRDVDFNWGIAPYPVKSRGGKAVSPCGSWGFYMTTNCRPEKQAAAVDLIKFMTSTEACVEVYRANGMPPARASAFNMISEFNELPESIIRDQVRQTAVARPLTKNYPVISDQFSQAVDNVVHGMDPKEALDLASSQISAFAK